MSKFALTALWLALAAEGAYVIVARLFLHHSWSHLLQPLAFTVLFGLLAASKGRIRWISSLLRIVIGLEFTLSVTDRLGLLGPPGHGVSWGDFTHFVSYTRQVNAFLPSDFAFPLAVLATAFETTLGLALIFGIGTKYVARYASVLLCLFGTAMILSGLIESQFFYGVFVLAAAAWLISTTDAAWLSIDTLWRRRMLLSTRQQFLNDPPA